MPANTDLKFRGYAVHDTSKWSEFKVIDFQPKTFEDYDIDIKIEYCGICGSDVHSVSGGWGKPVLPIIAGHEAVGTVVRVGPKVTTIKVGDRAGVGAQISSCFDCKSCKTDNEQYCHSLVHTYNDNYPNGERTFGGYSSAIRAHERYVFPIPDGLSMEQAAPMLCAGLTVYSALVRNGATQGSRVGIVGIGGLGHYAIQFAKALGAEVTVFSHSANKENDVKAMGADKFLLTHDKGFEVPLKGELDLIICAADVSKGIPLDELMSTLDVHGRFIMVALPDDKLPQMSVFQMARNAALFGSSHVGSKKEAIDMFDLAVKKGVKSWIEVTPMSEVGEAIQRVHNNQVRYRQVLKADL